MSKPAPDAQPIVPVRRDGEASREPPRAVTAPRPLRVLLRVPDLSNSPTAIARSSPTSAESTRRRARLSALVGQRSGAVWRWSGERMTWRLPRLQLQPKLLLVLVGGLVVVLVLAIMRGEQTSVEDTSLGTAPQWRAPEVELPALPVAATLPAATTPAQPKATATSSSTPAAPKTPTVTPPTSEPPAAVASKAPSSPAGVQFDAEANSTPWPRVSRTAEAIANEGSKISGDERPELRTALRTDPPRDMPQQHPFEGPPTARIEGHIVPPSTAGPQP